MSIIKWFIEKTKQLVQSHMDQKHNDKIEKEYATLIGDPNLTEEQYRQWCLDLTDEDLRQEALENERIYLEQCKKEDERIARQQKELMAEILEEKRIERLIEDEEVEAYFEKKYPRCYDCGQNSLHCRCEK